MKKKFTFLMALFALMLITLPEMVKGQSYALAYTLDGTTTGGSSAYDSESDITQSTISWKVMGNTTMDPWRIGGKSLSSVNRTIYSTSSISSNISKIEIEHGAASSITVNSMTVTVHNSAADAASGSNAIATFAPTFAANKTITITKSDATSWAGKYYRIVYNVSVSATSNKFLEFKNAKFYKTTATLTYSATEGGTISVKKSNNDPVASGSTLDAGTVLNIVATPTTGVFNNWACTGTGSSVGDASAASTTFTLGTANATLTANFVSAGEYITVTPNGSNPSPVGCNGDILSYTLGTNIASPSYEIKYYDPSTQEELNDTPNMIDEAEISGNALTITITANEGAARSACFKIKSGSTYSSLVTINQAAFSVAAPTFDPESETTFIGGDYVTLESTTTGATFRYTMGENPADPTLSTGIVYDPNEGIEVTASTTIKAIAIKNNTASAVSTATYTVLENLTTMDAIFTKATAVGSTATDVAVTFNDWVVVATRTSNVYITDGHYGMQIYQSNHGFNAGNHLSGTVTCKVQLYNNGAELTGITSSTTGLTITSSTVGTPYQIALSNDVNGRYFGSYVDLGVLTYNSSSQTFVKDNSNSISYNASDYFGVTTGLPTMTDGQTYKVKGVVYYTKSSNTLYRRIAPRVASDIEKYDQPVISAVSSLTVPSYVQGTPEESITDATLSVTGSHLQEDITCTLNENSNFVLWNGTTWTNTTTITESEGNASGSIRIRLKKDLDYNADAYVGTITLTSNEADNVVVNLSGNVVYAILTYNGNDSDGGNVPSAVNCTYNQSVTVAGNTNSLTKAGYNFGGWCLNDAGTGTVYGPEENQTHNISVTENTTLFAKWNAASYNITKDEEMTHGDIIVKIGEDVVTSATTGATVTLVTDPDADYVIESLTVKKGEDNVAVTPAVDPAVDTYTFTMPAGAVKVYATFKTAWKVEFSVNGTVDPSLTMFVNSGSALGSVPSLDAGDVPTGFTFKGWTASTGYYNATTPATTITTETVPTANITYAALYCVSTPGESHWTLTDAAPANGDAVILAAKNNNNYYAMFATTSALTTSAAFTITNSIIADADVPEAIWYVESGQYPQTDPTNTGLALYSGSDSKDGKLYLHINSSSGKIATTLQNGIFSFTSSGTGYTMTSDVNSRYLKFTSTSFGVSSSSSDLCTLYVFKEVAEPGTESNYTTLVTDEDISGNTTGETRIFGEIAATDDFTNNGTIHIYDGGVLDMGSFLLTNESAANLIIEDGGQLITSKSVKATFKKTTTASTDAKNATNSWYAISSPVGNIAISSFVPEAPTDEKWNVYQYDEPTHYWQEYRVSQNAFTELVSGRGYLYRSTVEDIEFAGDVNVADAKYTLSYTEENGDNAGLNLIGNPFSYNIYKGREIPNTYLEGNFYTLTPEGGWELGYDDGTSNPTEIKPNTGILVQAISSGEDKDLDISKSSKGGVSRYGKDQISFRIENSEYSDIACVLFREGRGLNKVNHRNAEIPMLYITKEGENFASANMPDNTSVINLGFEAKTMGQYTFSLKTEGHYSYMHLYDKLTGEDVDMLLEDSYTFIGSPSDRKDRFVLNLNYNAAGIDTESDIFAYQSGNDIIVSGEGELQVFDVMGRMVATQTVNGVQTVSGLNNGVYIFRMGGKTQKIVVR